MKIGFIGYGNMAASLASRWEGAHEVFIGGRDAGKAAELAQQLGGRTRSGSASEAAKFGDLVVLATTFDTVFDAIELAGGASAFAGKVILDINNPVDVKGDFIPKTFNGTSLSEAIAARAPEARVVKAFNMSQAGVWKMDPPLFDGRKLVVLYCGDDAAAKTQVAALIEAMGCDPFDLGDLKYARMLEPAAAIVIKLLLSGHDVHTVLNLIQPEKRPIA